MNRLVLFVALFLAHSLVAWAAGPALIPSGYGGGGRFTALAVDPGDPNRVVAGSDVAGLFVSRDGGDTFAPRGAGLGGLAVAGLAFDPGRPGTLAVLTDEGLYLSRDGGDTLARLGDMGYGDRFFGSHLLVPLGDDLLVATRSRGVFRVAWRQAAPAVTPVPGLEGRKVNSLARLGDDLFAATPAGAFVVRDGRFVAANAGLGAGRNLTDMAATPESGLFAVEERSGLWRYDAEKNTWERPGPLPGLPPGAKSPARFKALGLDPAAPGRVFLATHPDYWPYLLFVSDNGGQRFSPVTAFTLAPDGPPNYPTGLESVEALAFGPDGKTVFVADWWNLWKSRDGGNRFEQRHKGLQNTVVNALASVPGQPEAILAATADNGLMVSSDAGTTWARSMAGVVDGHVKDIRISPKDPAKRYLLAEPWKSGDAAGTRTLHLYRTLDGGASWQALPVTVPARTLPGAFASGRPTLLVIDPADDDAVMLGTGGHGLFRVDVPALIRGEASAVADIGRGLSRPVFFGPQSLLAFAEKPGLLVAATVSGGIWRSLDGGHTWTAAAAPGGFVFCLAADPSRPGHLLAGLPEKRLLESQDYGASWKERALPGARPPHIPVQAMAFDPARPGLVAVGTSAYDNKAADGLYVSRDGGATFSRVATETAPVGVTAISPGPGGLWVGFNGLGLWRLPDGR
ncbi:hypothetical protein G3N56_06330 [Desulfovibrio sulfodismutans]|uniref:Exo-alpha-sialidase n=1 Tax=Desulfolutivibrio sulfodismutans TaxID=63561 RepID=A0A7K3NMC8_9BACT|nr:sialidase family protein [Desulfolutivibrio sulfodismutans]NDY56359.1 hypothetical protein [Desulfolutivibrio sulfodismutans]QLA13468.1 hypothetical protein GD606_14950 [Desulfolutivibrio sulfodismutans DSM 3696]